MIKFIRYCLFTVSFPVFLCGILLSEYNIALAGILLMLLSSVLYSFESLKTRTVYLTFVFVFFVFLVSRPTIDMIKGVEWWEKFSSPQIIFSLISLFISLVALQIGAVIVESRPKKEKRTQQETYFTSHRFLISLQYTAMFLFYVAMVFFMIIELEKLLYMRGKEYEEFFVSFSSRLPYAIQVFASMMKYFLCIFLATMPNKRLAYFPIVLYVLSAVPSLLIGLRNPIVQNVVFALLYFVIRHFLCPKEKWFNVFEKAAVAIGTPVAVLFLAAYNYIRAGQSTAGMGVFDTIVDFFYKQGVSYDVLNIGYASIPHLPGGVKWYTFGPFSDYLFHNTLAQNLFGAVNLGSSNSIIKAVYGSSFAHSMSYVTRDDYLAGHGWGSSYILETFTDFGYVGVVVFSLLLGAFLICIMRKTGGNRWFISTFMLVVLTTLFFTPRAEALGSFLFICTTQFWVPVALCVAGAILFARSYAYYPKTINFNNSLGGNYLV